MGRFKNQAKADVCAFKAKRQGRFHKKNKNFLAKQPLRFVLGVHDESIFTYEAKLRHVWAVKGSKPRMLVTGSHRRSVVSGAITEDGAQLFRQYKDCDSVAFLDFLKVLLRKYPYLILFIDRAPWHREENVQRYIRKNKHRLKIRWFPPGFPESNPMEECWNQGKDEVLGSTFYSSFINFKAAIATYYRTRRFKLDLYKYLCH